MFDLFDLTNKIKDHLKNNSQKQKNEKNRRTSVRERSRLFLGRSESGKEHMNDLNKKTFGGMFVHSSSKEANKEKIGN